MARVDFIVPALDLLEVQRAVHFQLASEYARTRRQ